MATIAPKHFVTKSGVAGVVRVADVDDSEALLDHGNRNLVEEPYNVLAPGELDLTVEQEQATVREYQENPNRVFLVPELAGNVVGLLMFQAGSELRDTLKRSLGTRNQEHSSAPLTRT